MKIYLLWLWLCFPIGVYGQAISGRVTDGESGRPLIGASVALLGAKLVTISDQEGNFRLEIGRKDSVVLLVTYVGYDGLRVGASSRYPVAVHLKVAQGMLRQVQVATGYQVLPKERATGSFVQLDRELLNRRVGPDILSRLEDVTSGLVFNRDNFNAGNRSALSIRGQSTIFSNASPLVVLDNFPFEGDIASINPNDVESITVLRDAAAASQWGARSGNGVIVITTKKGRYDQGNRVSLNSNFTFGARPDLFYGRVLSSSDYIEIEKMLFAKGAYNAAETSINKVPLTPVVELLVRARNQPQLAGEINAEIERLKGFEVRDDYQKYLYRGQGGQQYALSANGGGTNHKYSLSAGYDRSLASLVGNQDGRTTLNASSTYAFLDRRLELTTNIGFTNTVRQLHNTGPVSMTSAITSAIGSIYPYARLADDNGMPLGLHTAYRGSFSSEALAKGLLDWTYSPLQELEVADNKNVITDYRINVGASYLLGAAWKASVNYQFFRSLDEDRQLLDQNSFTARTLINQFSSIAADGAVIRPIPLGAIQNLGYSKITAEQFRGQLGYAKEWGRHSLNAIGGMEVHDKSSSSSYARTYGYNSLFATGMPVSYGTMYNSYVNNAQMTIPYVDNQKELLDRFVSYYFNGAYTYLQRYIFSASARLDQSNLFGVEANQKGVPLYSLGAAWNLSAEDFFKLSWLSQLKLRATYGYNGNINKSVTAYTTAVRGGTTAETRLPFNRIVNPPNPQLRWERIRVTNLGVDFSLKGNRLGGSAEYYHKQGIELMGTVPYAPSTGISVFTGNTASTVGQGLDLVLNSKNLQGKWQWESNLLFSYLTEKVTDYNTRATAIAYLRNNTGLMVPMKGRPLYAIYSYRWAGLDPVNGDPMGYVGGQPSKDYGRIASATTPEELIYHGSARPLVFGALRNTVSWNNISVSVNLSYRLKYYIRRNSVRYGNDAGLGSGHSDYSLRWQKAGDEMFTMVPSVPVSGSANRDNLYQYAGVLVDRGDHVRLQDVNISYVMDGSKMKKMPFKRIHCYLYANHLGLVWKRTSWDLDPDYAVGSFPPVRTIAFGLRADF